jgi:hypothetical protein
MDFPPLHDESAPPFLSTGNQAFSSEQVGSSYRTTRRVTVTLSPFVTMVFTLLSTTVTLRPPLSVTNKIDETWWSRWVESMRSKDVECTFGILKGF